MKKSSVNLGTLALFGKTAAVVAAVTLVIAAVFAGVSLILETDAAVSVLFGSLSVAAGTFCGAFYLSRKLKRRGYLNGITVGIVTFIAVTVISLCITAESVTANTLFHFIFFLLAGMIGGIAGVNKKREKYI